ncbi:MAG: hypothetical protein MUF83_16210, partial [Acidimicrobiales bacterium]|nr:hypothetical protein [Acidimicrobiales bacterium]
AHPLVGAVALAVRGHHGVPTDEFAARLGLAPEVLAAVEAGHVPPQELPRPLIDGARFLPGLDLTRLGLT